MTFAGIAAVLASISAIVTGVVWVGKKISSAFTKSQDESNQDIDAQEQANKSKAEETGRPV